VAAAAAYALLIGDGIVAAASRRLDPGSRVSVGNPIDGGHGVLRHLVCAAPIGFDAGFSLDSGRVDIVQLVGVTEAEMEFAKLQGTEALLDALTARRLFVADNDRPSLTFKDFNANRGDSNA
jgi:hypothetical protein